MLFHGGLDVGDAVAIHLLAERARGFFQADLDEAAPQQRERLHALGRGRIELLQRLHGGLGAAVAREEAAELEAARGVAGAHAERGLEGARAVGGAAGALEAARGAAGVAHGGEGLARLEVRAEEREERAGLATEPARGEIGGGAAGLVVRQRRGDLLDGELRERLVARERGEERAAPGIGGEERLDSAAPRKSQASSSRREAAACSSTLCVRRHRAPTACGTRASRGRRPRDRSGPLQRRARRGRARSRGDGAVERERRRRAGAAERRRTEQRAGHQRLARVLEGAANGGAARAASRR